MTALLVALAFCGPHISAVNVRSQHLRTAIVRTTVRRDCRSARRVGFWTLRHGATNRILEGWHQTGYLDALDYGEAAWARHNRRILIRWYG